MSICDFQNFPEISGAIPMVTGRFYCCPLSTNTTTLVVTQDVLYASPLWVRAPVTITAISIEATAGAGNNVRLGIYRDSAGQPGALVIDAGATVIGIGSNSIAISTLLAPGLYWLACVLNGGSTVRALANSTGNAIQTLGFTTNTDTILHVGVSVAFVYAALPDPFTGGSALNTGAMPRMMVTL